MSFSSTRVPQISRYATLLLFVGPICAPSRALLPTVHVPARHLEICAVNPFYMLSDGAAVLPSFAGRASFLVHFRQPSWLSMRLPS